MKHFQDVENASNGADNSPIGLVFDTNKANLSMLNNDNSVSSILGGTSKTSKKRVEKRMKAMT